MKLSNVQTDQTSTPAFVGNKRNKKKIHYPIVMDKKSDGQAREPKVQQKFLIRNKVIIKLLIYFDCSFILKVIY